jgi:hypothetical protein
MSFTHLQTNAEEAQVPAVRPIDQSTQAILDDRRTEGEQFKEQEDDCKSRKIIPKILSVQKAIYSNPFIR